MLLGPLIFYLACYLCFGAIIYVQEVQLTTKKKQTMLKQPQLKLPSTSCLYKTNVYFLKSRTN